MPPNLDQLREDLKKRFQEGVELFNQELFWESHEAWEDVWHEIQGPDKIYVQGLIQGAAGLHHIQNENPKGARSMAVKALEKLTQFDLSKPLVLDPLIQCLNEMKGQGTLPEQFSIPKLKSPLLE